MSNLGTFDIGDEITITASFTNLAGAAANPSTLTFQVEKPDGAVVAYTQAAAEVANPATGSWTLTFVITDNLPGRWYVRCRSTAGVKAADEDHFAVRRSTFASP